jgi:hypothetical protein
VRYIRVYCNQELPNGRWDGFRIAIFDFTGGVPGSIVWPRNGEPKLVIPHTDCGWGWCDFNVYWPLENYRFVAAREQFFNGPDCDAACFDDDSGVTRDKHTWLKCDGEWSKHEGANLMLRVVVGDMGAVSPTSLGKVKGLYR